MGGQTLNSVNMATNLAREEGEYRNHAKLNSCCREQSGALRVELSILQI